MSKLSVNILIVSICIIGIFFLMSFVFYGDFGSVILNTIFGKTEDNTSDKTTNNTTDKTEDNTSNKTTERPSEEYYVFHVKPAEKYSTKDFPELEQEINYGTNNPLLNISVYCFTGKEDSETGYTGFKVRFENETNEVLEIVWKNTSLIYNGKSYRPVLGGHEYMKPTTIIPPNSTIYKDVFSSDQVYHYMDETGFNTFIHIINTFDVKIKFCVQLAKDK